ncbi:MAG: macro domain-containing protein [Candidatus Altiarchaeales archaeon]|nr:MAG: macro domain-containing protein [Candidatus Altiarchaeales archaeon]
MENTRIIVKKGDITREEVDAIVNPANSLGVMGGGVAYAIKRVGGEEIEREAMKKAPIPLGNAISTNAGKLKAKFIIHAPTMKNPVEKIDIENVRRATLAALKLASKLKVESIAFPGMGTGVGGVNKEDAANAMVNTIKSFINEDKIIKRIILVGFDDELENAFRRVLELE